MDTTKIMAVSRIRLIRAEEVAAAKVEQQLAVWLLVVNRAATFMYLPLNLLLLYLVGGHLSTRKILHFVGGYYINFVHNAQQSD